MTASETSRGRYVAMRQMSDSLEESKAGNIAMYPCSYWCLLEPEFPHRCLMFPRLPSSYVAGYMLDVIEF
ncbi:hypothetical protein STEG23_020231 [Scotinomys teguina]